MSYPQCMATTSIAARSAVVVVSQQATVQPFACSPCLTLSLPSSLHCMQLSVSQTLEPDSFSWLSLPPDGAHSFYETFGEERCRCFTTEGPGIIYRVVALDVLALLRWPSNHEPVKDLVSTVSSVLPEPIACMLWCFDLCPRHVINLARFTVFFWLHFLCCFANKTKTHIHNTLARLCMKMARFISAFSPLS